MSRRRKGRPRGAQPAPLGPQTRGWVSAVTCFSIALLWFRKCWLSHCPLDPWSPVIARWVLLPFSSEGQRHRTLGHDEGRPPGSAGLRITLTCLSPSPREVSTREGSDGVLRVVSVAGVAARPPGWREQATGSKHMACGFFRRKSENSAYWRNI